MPIGASDDMMTLEWVELAVAMPLFLVTAYQRLYEKQKTIRKEPYKCTRIQRSQHFYVHDRYGSRLFFYRRIRYRADYVKDRSWRCGITDHCILNCYNNVLRCLFRRSFPVFPFLPKKEGEMGAIIVTVIGTIAAIVYPMDNITNFFTSDRICFCPMIVVVIAGLLLHF